MPVSDAQKAAIEEIIGAIDGVTQGGRYKRELAKPFRELPNKEDYPDYFEVIPHPRCLYGVKEKLKEDGYENCLAVLEDLHLVFLNARHYNEEGSVITQDTYKLQGVLTREWKGRQVLPMPVATPPPPEEPAVQQVPAQQTTYSVTAPIPAGTRPTAPALSRSASNTTPLPTPPIASSSLPAMPTSGPPLRPISMRPRSPSPEIDVDGERGTPEPDFGPEEEAKDEESQGIISQLEKGVPRWAGLEDIGWCDTLNQDQFLELILVIKTQKDPTTGIRHALVLESIPEDARVPELPSIPGLSLKTIEANARAKNFASSEEFDKTMSNLFLKGRRFYEAGTEQYGRVLLLQRLYQALTSGSPPSGPPYVSASNFSSVRAGPGTARPMYSTNPDTEKETAPGVTTFRVSSKDRTFVDELQYKGWRVRLGDFVHVSNPDDTSRPIMGQVFRCFVSDEASSKGKPGLSVCWYYRPEQTIHPAHRLFWENEVFKTGHFADHTIDDMIERIGLQFTARHIRGRPRPPYWYPGWPLYVCDSRYNDRERCFVKIKNWSSCVPEDVRRRGDWMPLYPFERTVYPRRFPSPFVRGRGSPRGPGGIGDAIERAEGEKTEGGGTGRKRARKGGAGGNSISDTYGPGKGLYAGNAAHAPAPVQQALAAHHQQALQAQAQAQQTVQQRAPTPAQYQYNTANAAAAAQRLEDRSILQAAGGPVTTANASLDKLPQETAKFFERDGTTNEVLWFSAPPMNVARDPGPRHSLAYLHFLARKRKDAEQGGAGVQKRPRVEISLSERVSRAMADSLDESPLEQA